MGSLPRRRALRPNAPPRTGNVLAGSSPRARSAVLRYTLGISIAVERGLRIEFSGELWSFSDREPTDRHSEGTFHLAGVGTF